MRLSSGFMRFLGEDKPVGLFTAREAAQYLRVSLFTLGRMEKEGLLVPFRTPGGHRRYSREMLDRYLERSRSQRANHERRILVIDEGGELTAALASAFPRCRFATAQDELQAGIQLAQFKPDLVVVNTSITDMDGRDLCRRLDSHSQRLPVLAFEGPKPGESGGLTSAAHSLKLASLEESIADALRPASPSDPSISWSTQASDREPDAD